MEAREVWRIAGEWRKGAVKPFERRVLAWGALSLFLVGWSTVALTNVAETLFLKRVGVAYLPSVFLINSLLLTLTTLAIGLRTASADRRRFLPRTLLTLASLILVLWAAGYAGVPGALPALVVAAKQVQAIAALVFWVALGGWLDGRQAKRLFPLLMAGGTAGTLLGSFASAPLGAALGITSLLLVAAAALAAAAFCTVRLSSAVSARSERGPPRPRRPRRAPSPFVVWRQSGLFRLLAMSTLLGGMLAPVLYFQFSAVADTATGGPDGEQRLLALFSQFRGWLNLGVLFLQLVGTSWLFQRIGLPLASLVAPVVYLLAFVALGSDATLAVGLIAMAAATLQDHSLQEPAERALSTLFSERIRPTIAAWIDGPVKRTGGAIGNLLVLSTLAYGGPSLLAWTAAPLAFLWLGLVFLLWRAYPSLLLEGARVRRPGTAWPLYDLLDARTLRGLETSLLDPDHQRCRSACALVREAGGEASLRAVAKGLVDAPAANRPLLLETLTHLLERTPLAPNETTRAEVARALARPDGLDGLQRAALVSVYAQLGRSGRATPSEILESCLQDTAPEVRFAARIALADADSEHLLASVVDDPDSNVRAVAHTTLRSVLLFSSASSDLDGAWQRQLAMLASLLDSPVDRPAVANTLAAVAARHGTHAIGIASSFLAHRTAADPRVRTALLRYIRNTHLTKEARWVASRLGSPSMEESHAARECLEQLAPACMDVIVEVARSGTRRQREALRPLLNSLPIADATLAALVESNLAIARHVSSLATALARGPVSSLVLLRLQERADEALASSLSLLAARYGESRLAELGARLERVQGIHERAVAVEAIEALLPAGEKEAILPLLDAGGFEPPSELRRAGSTEGGSTADLEGALRLTLADEDELTRTFLQETLDESWRRRLGLAATSRGLGLPRSTGEEQDPALACEAATSEDASPNAGGGMLSRVEIVLHLRSLALFDRLRTRHLSEIAGIVHEESLAAGRTIVREGDYADAMYLIVSGTVHIHREGHHLASLGPRDFFGEMAVLDGELRSATATADTRVHLLRIDRSDLLEVMEEHPGIAIAICQALSRRVRNLNDEVRALRRDPT